MNEEIVDDDEVYDLELGDEHKFKFYGWHPDRALNPQYAHLPDIEKAGGIVRHIAPDGSVCKSGIMFQSDVAKEVFSEKACWQVISLEPLTLSPSLLCRRCGDHGFIQNGKWVRA